MGRNLLEEINNLKERQEFSLFNAYNERLAKVKATLYFLKENNFADIDEFYKYMPISCIAYIESYFRSIIKLILDKGEPYTSNLKKFNQSKNIKFDFEIVAGIQSKKLTIGEFIAHILPCNNLDDINSNLSTLLNIDFLKTIKHFNFTDHWIEDREKELFEPNAAIVYKNVQRTFELRHIFCHESNISLSVNAEEIEACFESCLKFLAQVSEYFYPLLIEYYGKSLPDRAELWSLKLQEKYENVNILIKAKRSKRQISPEDAERFYAAFDNTYNLWDAYITAKANLRTVTSMSGNYSQIFYCKSMIESIDSMIQELTEPNDLSP